MQAHKEKIMIKIERGWFARVLNEGWVEKGNEIKQEK